MASGPLVMSVVDEKSHRNHNPKAKFGQEMAGLKKNEIK